METINDRMEILVNQRFNGNKAAFAKAIGTERATLSNYIGSVRRSKPSVDLVSKILGHTSIKTTQVYAKVADEMKRKAVGNVPEI